MSPTLQPISPPPTNTPVLDPETGLLSSPWLLFFTDLFNAQKSQNGGITTNAGAASAAQQTANQAQAQIPITVGQETARAEAAETALGTRITNETTRAEAAEATLAPINNPTFTGIVSVPILNLTGGTSGTATAGAATLPANPVGFIVGVNESGTPVKIPYYNL